MLPALGSPTFIPALLTHLQHELSRTDDAEWTINPSLFSTLLLSQIVGPKSGGVIVDVIPSESARKGIGRVVDHTTALTRGVFGQSTLHLPLTRHTHPTELPYSLFIDAPEDWRNESLFEKPAASRRSTTTPSSSRYVSALPSPVPTSRTRSYRNSRTNTPGITPKSSIPLLSDDKPNTHAGSGSGLGSDVVSAGAGRNGFGPLLIPRAHGTLASSLDEFGPDDKVPYLPQCLVISGMERTNSTVWIKMVDIIQKGYVEIGELDEMDYQDQQMSNQENDDDSGPAARRPTAAGRKRQRWDLPDGFWVIWIRDEDKSDACYSWLTDQFSCSISLHPDDLDTPSPVSQRAVIPSSYIESLHLLLAYTHIHPPLQSHISNLLSAVSTHPRLHSSITSQAVKVFPEFVKAHRLLSAPFYLPDGWEEGLRRRREILQNPCQGGIHDEGRVGVKTRGIWSGFIEAWTIQAGEEPDLSTLMEPKSKIDNEDVQDALDVDGDEWYCQPINVEAVFSLVLRHKSKWREEREEVMWLLRGSSLEGFTRQDSAEVVRSARSRHLNSSEVGEVNGKIKARMRGRRKRKEVDMLFETILLSV